MMMQQGGPRSTSTTYNTGSFLCMEETTKQEDHQPQQNKSIGVVSTSTGGTFRAQIPPPQSTSSIAEEPKAVTASTSTSSSHWAQLDQNQQKLSAVCSSWEQMSYQLMAQNDHNFHNGSTPLGGYNSQQGGGGFNGGHHHNNGGGNKHHHHHMTRQPTVAASLFDGLKEAQETSTNLLDLMNKTIHAIAIGFPCTVVLGGLTVLPISMIAVGGGNYYKCPASDWLPAWLIVTGILLMFFCILLIRIVGKLRQEESGELLEDFDASGYKSSKNFVWVLSILQLGWFCLGNYLVLSIYYPHTEIPHHPPFLYCSEALYNFSLFWIGAVYSTTAAILACLIFTIHVYYRNSKRYMSFEHNSYDRL